MINEELEAKLAAQRKYCRDRKHPHFAPSTGKCVACGKQIYEKISLEEAGGKRITGCPHCHRSFFD